MSAIPPFTITSETTDGVCVVAVAGEVDLETAPQVRKVLAAAEAGDARVIQLVLSQVTFMDSTGLSVLVEHTQRSRADGNRMRILSSPAVDRVLEVSGLRDHLPVLS